MDRTVDDNRNHSLDTRRVVAHTLESLALKVREGRANPGHAVYVRQVLEYFESIGK